MKMFELTSYTMAEHYSQVALVSGSLVNYEERTR